MAWLILGTMGWEGRVQERERARTREQEKIYVGLGLGLGMSLAGGLHSQTTDLAL